MKTRILSFAVLLMLSIASFAQQEVTKFMGIPVDGFKKDMIQKLEAKGFEYDKVNGYLTGEFNGDEVMVFIKTNNNKVWRIALVDKLERDEGQIKIRYNNLCHQFQKNKKYSYILDESPIIPDDEQISYEMTVNKKQYQAVFCQKQSNANDSILMAAEIQERMVKILKDDYHTCLDSIQAMPKKESEEIGVKITKKVFMDMFEELTMRHVWFTINERYGNYVLTLFYDNEYNNSHGEDL